MRIVSPVSGTEATIADLDDVIRSKEAAGRLKDLRVLPALYWASSESARQQLRRRLPSTCSYLSGRAVGPIEHNANRVTMFGVPFGV